jgi:hypothetical protein
MDSQDALTQDQLHDLLWRVRLSSLYHLKRERFLDGIDRAAKATSALGGAAAFSQIRSDPGLGLLITGFISVVSSLSLVYGPSTKARKHADLARDFKLLESEITAEVGLTAQQIAKFNSRYQRLEASEPASLGALVTQCHNELSMALGQRSHITPLPLWQRLFKNWVDIDQTLPADKTSYRL